MAIRKSNKLKRHSTGRVRIVSGKYRGRVIHFPALKAVRPTPLRLRETLFNWLAGEVQGRRCLDLFAGSGALGFECISRGAAKVTMVDNHPLVIRALRDSAKLLNAGDHLRIVKDSAETFARHQLDAGGLFDVVFADPPFGSMTPTALMQLVGGLVPVGGWLYLEAEGRQKSLPVGCDFTLLKESRVGEVRGRLFNYQPGGEALYNELVIPPQGASS